MNTLKFKLAATGGLFAVAAALAVVSATPAAAHQRRATAASSLPTIYYEGAHKIGFAVRPKGSIPLSGDGSILFAGSGSSPVRGNIAKRNIKWTSWTSSKAVGTGELYENNCKPDCASGHFYGWKGSATATAPKHGKFQKLAITFTQHHKTIKWTGKLKKAGGTYFWDVTI